MMEYRQLGAAFIASGIAFSSGTALSWTNPVELAAKNGTLGFDISDKEFAWLGPVLSLGALISCVPSGFLVDAIGRQKVITLTVIPFTIGWSFVVLATNIWMLYVGRFFLGLVFGTTSIAVPLYICEIAQKEIRGILGSFVELQIMFGVLFVFLIGAFAQPLVLTLACSVVPLFVALGMLFVPESPNFLINKGKHENAAKSIKWLHRRDIYMEVELDDMKTNDEIAQEMPKSFFEALKSRASAKAFFINIGLMTFQQLSGINPITFYSTAIFASSSEKSSSLEPRYSTLLIGVVQFVATLVSLAFIEKLGRRLLLLISAALMALSLLFLGIYFHLYERHSDIIQRFDWFPVFGLCAYVVTFAFGFGPIPWIMLGELFPTEIKGPASSVTITVLWLMSFIADKAAIMAKNVVGLSLTFYIFAFSTIVSFFFVLMYVPETKGKSLDEIQTMLSKKKSND